MIASHLTPTYFLAFVLVLNICLKIIHIEVSFLFVKCQMTVSVKLILVEILPINVMSVVAALLRCFKETFVSFPSRPGTADGLQH